MMLIGPAILALLGGGGPAELRGVWLTTTANDALASRSNIARTMSRLKRIGFNTVYVEVWKNGYTQFPSPTLKRLIGVDRHPALRSRDLLGEVVAEARRQGMRCVAWFEYGFMAAHEGTHNELLRRRREWMTTTADGKLVSPQNPFVWMNPMRPEPQALLLGIIRDALQRYRIDGIQLDDRIAWPTSMGYDPYTKAAYVKEHGKPPPLVERDPAWVAWRAARVTRFAQRLDAEIRRVRPAAVRSISPAVYPWSLEHYACDWPKWRAAGLMTEYVPQVYRAAPAAFARDWQAQLQASPGTGPSLAAGIMVNSGEAVVPWEDLRRNLDVVRASGHGHVLWYSRGVLGSHAEKLREYYRTRVRPKEGSKSPANASIEL